MINVPNPWLPSSPCRDATEPLPLDTVFPPTSIHLWLPGALEPEEIIITVDRDLFTYEADSVAENNIHRQSPAMSWRDTLGNMELLDRWRGEGNIVYESDKSHKI